MENEKGNNNNFIAILGLFIAIATLLFGDNLYERFTGRSLFSQESSPTSAPLNPIITVNDTPTPYVIPTSVPTISSIDFIASIDTKIKDLKFFESGYDIPSSDQRVYSTRFMREKARYINWEINLDYPQPGQRIDFIIHAIYYKPGGSVFAEQDFNAYVLSDWSSSQHAFGRGWKEAGNWEIGTYTVVLYVNNIEIVRASFIIE